MENASKALIIAGAILISILIVGLGVIIYNNVADTAKSGTLDEQQISAHNSPFESYFGNNISGSNVKALISAINNNNRTAKSNDDTVGNYIFVKINNNNKSAFESTITSDNIKTGKNYKVSLGGNGEFSDDTAADDSYWTNGYIKYIVITESTSTSNP